MNTCGQGIALGLLYRWICCCTPSEWCKLSFSTRVLKGYPPQQGYLPAGYPGHSGSLSSGEDDEVQGDLGYGCYRKALVDGICPWPFQNDENAKGNLTTFYGWQGNNVKSIRAKYFGNGVSAYKQISVCLSLIIALRPVCNKWYMRHNHKFKRYRFREYGSGLRISVDASVCRMLSTSIVLETECIPLYHKHALRLSRRKDKKVHFEALKKQYNTTCVKKKHKEIWREVEVQVPKPPSWTLENVIEDIQAVEQATNAF
ncbi:hypothetical protein Tco_1088852 [Tanacetum coccineum]